jgi:hypothetical protein
MFSDMSAPLLTDFYDYLTVDGFILCGYYEFGVGTTIWFLSFTFWEILLSNRLTKF